MNQSGKARLSRSKSSSIKAKKKSGGSIKRSGRPSPSPSPVPPKDKDVKTNRYLNGKDSGINSRRNSYTGRSSRRNSYVDRSSKNSVSEKNAKNTISSDVSNEDKIKIAITAAQTPTPKAPLIEEKSNDDEKPVELIQVKASDRLRKSSAPELPTENGTAAGNWSFLAKRVRIAHNTSFFNHMISLILN